MKLILAAVLALFALAGCSTTGEQKPADIPTTIGKVCPPVKSTLVLLRVSPSIQPHALEALDKAEPYVTKACDPTTLANLSDIYALADIAIPEIVKAIADSDLKPDQKEIAIISLTVAQVAIAAAK